MKTPIRYPTYKKTGVEWLPSVPESWDVSSLKYVCDIQLGKMLQNRAESESDVEVSYLKAQHVTWMGVNTEDLPTMWASMVDTTKYEVKNGDLLVCEGGEVGRASIVEKLDESKVTLIQNALHRVRGSSLYDVCFLKYLLENIERADWFSVLCNKATIAHLTSEKIGAIQVPIPSLSEQQKIVAFLEHKTAKIDALIEKKRALIEKLDEKRTAVITQAVTKGLDPNAPMKDPGVAWLGEVPAHWETWKVTHGFDTIGSGTTPKSDNPMFYDGETPWITTSELRENVIHETAQHVTDEALQEYSTLRLYPAGSLAFAMYGATIGRLGILGIPATVNQACCVFANPTVFNTEFFFYWLQMRRPILISLSVGGGQPNLSQDDLKQIRVPVPSLKEQGEIVSWIQNQENRIKDVIAKNQMLIDKLTEYRSSLVTAGVTGQIDARSLTIGLSDAS